VPTARSSRPAKKHKPENILVEYIVIDLEILLLILPAYKSSTLSLYLRLFNT